MHYKVYHAYDFLHKKKDVVLRKEMVEGHCFPHSHDFIEIAYIASGSGFHFIEGENDEISHGDLFLIGEHVSHEFISQPADPLIVYNCIFLPLSVEGDFNPHSEFGDMACRCIRQTLNEENSRNSFIKITGLRSEKIEQVIKEMYVECNRREKGYMQLMHLNLVKLLILIFRLYQGSGGSEQNLTNCQCQEVQNAVEYLRLHYAENIDCAQLASQAYMSPTYFSQIFKQQTSKTIIGLLQEIRIERACSLLENTDLSVNEIARQVGYTDLKFFYRLFRRHKSLTPGNYRNKNKIAQYLS